MSELKGAELQRALAGLRDVHLPAGDAPAAPLAAPGWPELAALLLTSAVIALLVIRWRRRGAPRRRLRRAVAQLAAAHGQTGDTPALLAGFARLLRAQAIARHGSGAAGLCGEAWLRWLGEHAPPRDAGAFPHGVGRALVDSAFRAPVGAPAVDDVALRALVTRWLEHNAC